MNVAPWTDTIGAGSSPAVETIAVPLTSAPVLKSTTCPLTVRFADLAAGLDRGMWVEFEGEDGQLAFAKLAWVSPLRGTYLFTNRQGQKAVSLTADELAERFRADRARLVEAEPLIDRAFTSMVQTLEEKFGGEATPAGV